MDRKIKKLESILKKSESVVVAYSGGVDSTFLLKMAKDVLGRDNVFAVTAKSELFPDSEFKDAQRLARYLGVKHTTINTHELKNKNFVKNPVNRCYYCKKELFSRLKEMARNRKIDAVIDGTNFDDLKDLRFGRKAAQELGVRSPLMEAGLTKQDIRDASKKMRLRTWDKGTFACLASRFPHNRKINKSELKKIEKLEAFLKSLGFKQVRVRMHKELVRIEVGTNEISCLVNDRIRKQIIKKFKHSGFNYVTLDLAGYRTGSMNEIIR